MATLGKNSTSVCEQGSNRRNPPQCGNAIMLVRLGGLSQFWNKKQKETSQLILCVGVPRSVHRVLEVSAAWSGGDVDT